MNFGAGIIWVIVAVVVVALIVIVVVMVTKKRGSDGPDHMVDPPYDRKGVDNPTVDDPQAAPGVEPEGARFVEDPDAMRNPTIEEETPGQPMPGTFPPPGPPRE